MERRSAAPPGREHSGRSPTVRPISLLNDRPASTALAPRREREGREEARQQYGGDASQGHDDRIDHLKDTELLLANQTAHLDDPKHEYTKQMQDTDLGLKTKLEEENNKRWQTS